MTDFGFAACKSNKLLYKADHGSPFYKAPEFYQANEVSKVCTGVDIWAMGVMTFYMLSEGTYPFFYDDLEEDVCDLQQRIIEEEPNYE